MKDILFYNLSICKKEKTNLIFEKKKIREKEKNGKWLENFHIKIFIVNNYQIIQKLHIKRM